MLKSLSRRKGENTRHSTHLKEVEFPPQPCDDSSDKVHPTSFDNQMISNDSDAKAFKVFDELLSELQSQLHCSVLCQGPDHSPGSELSF